MRKQPKPCSQEPSRYLSKFIDSVDILKDKPVVDVACGYGRNGMFLVNKGFRVIFTNIDRTCLDYISAGCGASNNRGIDPSLVKTYCTDITREWPFTQNSLSGIVNVHFYRRMLLLQFVSSIQKGGFLYLETLPARIENCMELVRNQEAQTLIQKHFEILFLRESYIKGEKVNLSSVRIFGIKK